MKFNCFRKKSFFADNFEKVVENLDQEDQKNYLYIRYLRILRKIENNSKRSTFWYFTLSTIVTVGSIVVPALISIQDEELQKKVYWPMWSISVSVTMSNAIIKLFNIDKNYITRNIKLDKFKSEGSTYLSQTDKYNIDDDKERFEEFVKNIEALKKQQIMEEFTQRSETSPLRTNKDPKKYNPV